jgi:hypothetical protein
MSRIHRTQQTTNAAVHDRYFRTWEEANDEINIATDDFLLLQPVRNLGGIANAGPMESYRQMLQLVETRGNFSSDVLHAGARTLQRHFHFED